MIRSRLTLGLALTASLIASGLLAAPPASAAPKCFGKVATIVGTGGADTLFGTAGPDVILGLGGKDLLVGRGGADRLCGGKAADEQHGEGGKDKLAGGPKDDLLIGQGADDLLVGQSGNDLLDGSGNGDTLKGGKGGDLLLGFAGNDTLRGGPSFDFLYGEGGNDVVDGDAGDDLASFAFSTNPAGITASLATGIATGEGTDTLQQVNGLEGSFEIAAPDRFTGNDEFNFFRPLEGDDVVDGAGGDDLLVLAFASAPVTVDLNLQTASGEGNDSLTSIEHATGSWDFGDTLLGSDGPNVLFGLDGDDDITALAGDDFLIGGEGSDEGDGGEGTDECVSIETVLDDSCEVVTPSMAARPTGWREPAGVAWASPPPTSRAVE